MLVSCVGRSLVSSFWKENSEIEDACNNHSRQQGEFLSNICSKVDTTQRYSAKKKEGVIHDNRFS